MLFGSEPTRCQYNPKEVVETTPKKITSSKFILSILSDVENFAEFNGEIIFQILPKMAEVSQKNPSMGYSGPFIGLIPQMLQLYTTDLRNLGSKHINEINVLAAESGIVKHSGSFYTWTEP